MTVLLYLFEISYAPPNEYKALVYEPNADYINGYFTFERRLDDTHRAILATETQALVKSEESFMSEPRWIKILPNETAIIPASSFYKIYIRGSIDVTAHIKFSNKNLGIEFDYKHLAALHDMMDSPYIKIGIDDAFICDDNIILQSTIPIWIKPTHNGIISTPITILNYDKGLFSKIFMFNEDPIRYSTFLTDMATTACSEKLKQYVAAGLYGLFVS